MSDTLYPSRLRRNATEQATSKGGDVNLSAHGSSTSDGTWSAKSQGPWSLAKYRAFLDDQERKHPEWAESLQVRRVVKLHLEARALLARSREGGSVQLRLATLENTVELLLEASELR